MAEVDLALLLSLAEGLLFLPMVWLIWHTWRMESRTSRLEGMCRNLPSRGELARLESMISAMPAGSDISRLDVTLADLRFELVALSTHQDHHTVEVHGIADSLRRVEDYLIARLDHHQLLPQVVNDSIDKLCVALRDQRNCPS